MKRSRSLVSVLMPVYNTSEFLAASVESVLKQDYGRFELLIVDDGSADKSWAVLSRFADDSRVRAFRRPHRGVARARNLLLRFARGRYIVNHDSDDLMLPGRLKKQAAYLDRHPETGGVYGDTLIHDPKERPFLGAWRIPSEARQGRYLFPATTHCAFMFRKSLMKRAGWYDPSYVIGEDVDMLVRLALAGRLVYQKGLVFMQEVRKDSTTHRFPWTPGTLDEVSGKLVRSFLTARRDRIHRLRFGIHDAQVRLETNSRRFLKALDGCMYIQKSIRNPAARYAFEIYELPSLGGIFPHLRSLKEETLETRDGKICWRSKAKGIAVIVDVPRRHALFCVEESRRVNPDAFLEYAFLYPFLCLERPRGRLFLHSGAVAGPRGAALFLGNAYAGKTTLSLKLLERGFQLLSDETNIVSRVNGAYEVAAFPWKVKIKEVALKHFPLLMKSRRKFLKMTKGRWMFDVDQVPGWGRTGKSRAALVIFPEYRSGARARLRPITPSTYLAYLRSDRNGYLTFGTSGYEEVLAPFQLYARMRHHLPVYHALYCDSTLENLADMIAQKLEKSPC